MRGSNANFIWMVLAPGSIREEVPVTSAQDRTKEMVTWDTTHQGNRARGKEISEGLCRGNVAQQHLL